MPLPDEVSFCAPALTVPDETSDDTVIRMDRVSKCYHVYASPRERLKQFFIPPLRHLAGCTAKSYFREFWALRDVSLSIRRGETLGIIGRNGAGKSTLLQILCGTLSVTQGTVALQGRVAALLELGAGFNGEFTGRENVYLNASLLGLRQDEIDARFEAIEAFADIGEFIDQPVKTYSSGMFVRLAFAVIAHVDADILIVDEALAVGDAAFTQKCMRFLRKFMANGTLVFVSHDTGSVVNLCKSAIWLDHGQIRETGDAKAVTEAYLRSVFQESYSRDVSLTAINEGEIAEFPPEISDTHTVDEETQVHFFDRLEASSGWKSGAAQIVSVSILGRDGTPLLQLAGGEQICLAIRAVASAKIDSPIIGFYVKDRLGQFLFGDNTFLYADPEQTLAPGQHAEARFCFQLPLLPNGDYSIAVAIAEGDMNDHVHHHWLHDAVIFKVLSNKQRFGLVGIPFHSVSLSIES